MRRKNRPKVVWLPPTLDNSVDAGGRSVIALTSFIVDHQVIGNTNSLELDVVQDGTQSGPLNPTASLADIENSGYRLRRIVGEIYIFAAQSSTSAATAAQFIVTAGFMIRRTDPATGLSLASTSGDRFINLDDVENSMDPWIWRRSWIMANDGTNGASATPLLNSVYTAQPHDNFTRAGTLHTGPHVDQKTARVVGPEERLVLNISATTILADSSADTATAFAVFRDLRVLASMRTSIGNRRNASR